MAQEPSSKPSYGIAAVFLLLGIAEYFRFFRATASTSDHALGIASLMLGAAFLLPMPRLTPAQSLRVLLLGFALFATGYAWASL